jgi:hypothetical protein
MKHLFKHILVLTVLCFAQCKKFEVNGGQITISYNKGQIYFEGIKRENKLSPDQTNAINEMFKEVPQVKEIVSKGGGLFFMAFEKQVSHPHHPLIKKSITHMIIKKGNWSQIYLLTENMKAKIIEYFERKQKKNKNPWILDKIFTYEKFVMGKNSETKPLYELKDPLKTKGLEDLSEEESSTTPTVIMPETLQEEKKDVEKAENEQNEEKTEKAENEKSNDSETAAYTLNASQEDEEQAENEKSNDSETAMYTFNTSHEDDDENEQKEDVNISEYQSIGLLKASSAKATSLSRESSRQKFRSKTFNPLRNISNMSLGGKTKTEKNERSKELKDKKEQKVQKD